MTTWCTRHTERGKCLTPTEKSAIDKLKVLPGMDALSNQEPGVWTQARNYGTKYFPPHPILPCVMWGGVPGRLCLVRLWCGEHTEAGWYLGSIRNGDLGWP